jgi:hypothetical protein
MRRAAAIALALAAALLAAHVSIVRCTVIAPPSIAMPQVAPAHVWTRVRAGVREVHLEGSPEAIGAAHARLLRAEMIAVESQLWGDFERYVPLGLARVGIQDWSRLRYRHVDRGIPGPRRRELAAEALAFEPDPFDSHMPTYQRMVFLHALYDIALSFEHSPLVGCTSFALDPSRTTDGHTLVARAFDFEAGDAFDRGKAVFFVREEGAVPFASVAWPGLVGVVTGMNAEGVFVAVHGARAREPSSDGIPVTFSVREALSRAHDTQEAVAILGAQAVMVSHLVFVADAAGHFAVVERAPGAPAFVRSSDRSTAVTNHFEGALAADPKNLRVREVTSTVARRRRADELLGRVAPGSARPEDVLAILRDHGCAGDGACPPGDRRAIDALIATHGVVADTTGGVLWVSAGPHLSGAFVRFDVRRAFSAPEAPDRGTQGQDRGATEPDQGAETMPPDGTLGRLPADR